MSLVQTLIDKHENQTPADVASQQASIAAVTDVPPGRYNAAMINVAHPELIDYLNDVKSWNDFAHSIITQLTTGKYRTITENQLNAVLRMKNKANSKQVSSLVFDISKLVDAYETVKSNGLKRFRFIVGNLRISSAPESGVNAGHFYVKEDDNYIGKIKPNGESALFSNVDSLVIDKLHEIFDDPIGEAIKHGKGSGECSCCGRELTDQESIDRGIGPICAKNWGWL